MSIEDKWKKFIGEHKKAEKIIVKKRTVEKVVEELLNNLSGEKLNFKTKIEKSGVKYNPYYSIPTEYEEIMRNFYYVNEMLEAIISNYRSMKKIIKDCGNIMDITKMYGLRISTDNTLNEKNPSELEKKLENTEGRFRSEVLKLMMKFTKYEFVESLKKRNTFYLELERKNKMKLLSITYQKKKNSFKITIYYNNLNSLKEGQASWTKGKILHDLGGIVKML